MIFLNIEWTKLPYRGCYFKKCPSLETPTISIEMKIKRYSQIRIKTYSNESAQPSYHCEVDLNSFELNSTPDFFLVENEFQLFTGHIDL